MNSISCLMCGQNARSHSGAPLSAEASKVRVALVSLLFLCLAHGFSSFFSAEESRVLGRSGMILELGSSSGEDPTEEELDFPPICKHSRLQRRA